MAAPLANRLERDADAVQIAEAIVATWQEIDAAVAPIIGRKGVVALYERSLDLTAPTHPWLAGPHEGAQAAIDFAALKSAVLRQGTTDAALGANALFQTFHRLLDSLVGPSLTERLLGAVWADASSKTTPQDTTPCPPERR